MIKFLDLHKQYLSIREEVDAAVDDVIARSAFIGGEQVAAFEAEFAAYQSAAFCVGVGNGTDAIEIALEALELPPDSEVIVPANSFIASSEAVTRAGHRVVFCDVNASDYTLDVDDLESRVTSRTAAVMAVHLYGHPCDMAAVGAFAERHGLKVIEDCAQAHGAEFRGRRVGTIGDVGTFSFYPGKNLGAYGDAGAIVTDSESLAVRCRMIANHGRIAKYDHEFEGRNSRLDGLQAAVLRVKLRHLERWTESRIAVADRYLQALGDIDAIELPVRSPDVRQVYHLFVVRSERRDELRQYLSDAEIHTGIHYPVALPDLEAYAGHRLGNTMLASRLAAQVLSLPIGEHMTTDDAQRVATAVDAWARG